jgi:hypothetical protein
MRTKLLALFVSMASRIVGKYSSLTYLNVSGHLNFNKSLCVTCSWSTSHRCPHYLNKFHKNIENDRHCNFVSDIKKMEKYKKQILLYYYVLQQRIEIQENNIKYVLIFRCGTAQCRILKTPHKFKNIINFIVN